jgi:hypothetical protein
MATLTLDYPNADAIAIRDDLCEYGGYQDTIDGAPNPLTRAQFAKKVAAQLLKDAIQSVRIARARAAVTTPPDIT